MVNTNLRVTPGTSPNRMLVSRDMTFTRFSHPGPLCFKACERQFRLAHCTKQQVFIKRLGIVMNTALNRRTFIAAAGAAGASIATASMAIAEEPPAGEPPADAGQDSTLAAPNGTRPDYPWAAEPPVIADDMIEEEVDTEVIVVGCGIAGCTAIRAAVEEGAKVVWFEKTTGNTAPGRQFAIINSEANKVWGNYGILDRDEVVNHEMDEGGYFAKRSIYTRWFDEVGGVFDWYFKIAPDIYICKDMYDFPPNGDQDHYVTPLCWPQPEEYDYTQEAYPTYPTSAAICGRELDAMALEYAEENGGKGYYETRVEQLIKDDSGRVTGVYAYNYNTGKYIKATASKGVVLACGDYVANDEFVKFFLSEQIYNNNMRMGMFRDPNGDPVAQGEGLVMGDWAGAMIQLRHALMIHHMGSGPLGCTPFLLLNKDGKRFMNEEVPGQQLENQLEIQRDMTGYMIFDANWPAAIPFMPPAHGSKSYYVDDDQASITESMIEPEAIIYPKAVEDGVEQGTLVKGDTLEELFAQLDIDANAAAKAVERYNKLCANGYDEDFGKSPKRLFPIETGPFYVSTFSPAASLACVGGLESDEECHVYDRDRKIIPGLYVAGNIQGSRFTVQYPIAVAGIARSMGLFYGYIAGKNVVAGV